MNTKIQGLKSWYSTRHHPIVWGHLPPRPAQTSGGMLSHFLGKKKNPNGTCLEAKAVELCGAGGDHGTLRPWGQTAPQQSSWCANPTSKGMHSKGAPKIITFLLGLVLGESVGLLRNARLQIYLSIPRIRTTCWVFNYCTYLFWAIAFLRVTEMQFYWNFSLNTLLISSVQRCLKTYEDQDITFIFSFSVLNFDKPHKQKFHQSFLIPIKFQVKDSPFSVKSRAGKIVTRKKLEWC